ncbi:MAG: hypothetical protein AAGC56_01185 [Pseudomonadota bacterium]
MNERTGSAANLSRLTAVGVLVAASATLAAATSVPGRATDERAVVSVALVLTSNAAAWPAGAGLSADDTLSLQPGETVVIVRRSGRTETLTGPGEIPILSAVERRRSTAAAIRAAALGLDDAAVIGAARGADCDVSDQAAFADCAKATPFTMAVAAPATRRRKRRGSGAKDGGGLFEISLYTDFDAVVYCRLATADGEATAPVIRVTVTAGVVREVSAPGPGASPPAPGAYDLTCVTSPRRAAATIEDCLKDARARFDAAVHAAALPADRFIVRTEMIVVK